MGIGYSSDLIWSFFIRLSINTVTTGAKQIDARQFYLRLAQRIIHLFSTEHLLVCWTKSMRLRPSGESGMLVSTIQAFDEYQKMKLDLGASGLIRARMICSDDELQQMFSRIRHETLCLSRDADVTE